MKGEPAKRSGAGDRRKPEIEAALAEMRARTIDIVSTVSDTDLVKVHEPTMGPVNWDLGHIPYFEELFLVRALHGRDALSEDDRRRGRPIQEIVANEYDPTWDAEMQPRPTRAELPIPDIGELRAYGDRVRAKVLETLANVDLDSDDPLLADGFVYDLIVQHEAQHQENILITLQLIPGRYTPSLRVPKPAPQGKVSGMAVVDGGPFPLGATQRTGIYDNEGPAHDVELAPYRIAKAPVTNGEYLRFMEAGGYDDEDLWDPDGWDMRMVHRWSHPKFWSRDANGEWFIREADETAPLPLDQPVIHVSWFEADAYARWAGMRLPTEAEWEKAATWDPATRTKRRHPWGDAPWTPEHANLDQRLYGTAPVGAYPKGASAYGCHQMLGDAWEWTSSTFDPYPGYRPFPYNEYSTPFLGRGFKVLRGGAWATRANVARGTFRNWHQPDHQQIFAGFRLAADLPEGDAHP